MSKICFDAGVRSPIDHYNLTLMSTGTSGAGLESVLPVPCMGQLQAIGTRRLDPDWTADFAQREADVSPDTHGPVGREVTEAIRLLLMATH